MKYEDFEDNALPIGKGHGVHKDQWRQKSSVFGTLLLYCGAALVVYALSSILRASNIFQDFDCGRLWADGLTGDTVNQYEFIGSRAIDKSTAKSSNLARHFNSLDLTTIREIDMTQSNGTREGQPVVAVNPLNPDNIVYVTTRFYPLPSLEPVGGCFLAYTFDRGRTWTNITASYPLGIAPKCGEPQVSVDANGTFYILNNQVFSGLEANMAAHPQVSKSTDGGRTWTDPSVTPLYMQGAPKLRIDIATGKIYANGASSWEYPAAVSVSSDGGETWAPFNQIPGPIDICLDYEIDNLPPVCGFPGRSIAVHDGILASAAQGVDGNPEMYISRDDGMTWSTLPLTDSEGRLVANGTGPMMPVSGIGLPSDPTPWVSADPTKTGRFALMIPREFTLEIYITENSGKTFRGPTLVQSPDAQRPAMDFGSTGLLGIMWRTNSSGLLDVYSTVSFDSGRTFATPLKVTHLTQTVGSTGQPGDRTSFIALTDRYAYIAWSDGRDGLLDGILAEVPINLYNQTINSHHL